MILGNHQVKKTELCMDAEGMHMMLRQMHCNEQICKATACQILRSAEDVNLGLL